MPKAPPTVDRFRLSCECEVSDLGGIIAQLTKMGMTNLHFELVTDVQTFRKTSHDINAQDFLTAWVKDHPTFRAVEAARHFEASGRARGSVYSALGLLIEAGVLKKLGEGQYSRTDVKAIAAPKAKRQTFDKTGPAVILSYGRRNHGRVNTTKLNEIFANEGRAKGSVSASIDKLLRARLIKRVGDGQYVLLTKATPAKKPEKTNSNGAAIEVETANG